MLFTDCLTGGRNHTGKGSLLLLSEYFQIEAMFWCFHALQVGLCMVLCLISFVQEGNLRLLKWTSREAHRALRKVNSRAIVKLPNSQSIANGSRGCEGPVVSSAESKTHIALYQLRSLTASAWLEPLTAPGHCP
jgi:hypothetical protein